MSNSNAAPVPGLLYPTQKGMLSGNPRDSAIASQTQVDTKQTNLSNAVGGKGKKRRIQKTRGKKSYSRRRGGAGADTNANAKIVVPQFQMQYQPTGGPGQDPNSVIQQNSQTSTQANANAVYDQYATQKGGVQRKTRKFGGTDPKWNWGCYSGGKSSRMLTKRRLHKTRKNHKRRN
jgi:hypothetical protein